MDDSKKVSFIENILLNTDLTDLDKLDAVEAVIEEDMDRYETICC